MKQKIFIVLLLVTLTSICFAQTTKYRYAIASEQSLMIVDLKEKIPEENLNDTIIPMNTKQERFIAESGLKNLQSFFYSGVSFIYADYTKNPDDPDMSYIDTWSDVIAYVRGTK